jgi:hypothetical protein
VGVVRVGAFTDVAGASLTDEVDIGEVELAAIDGKAARCVVVRVAAGTGGAGSAIVVAVVEAGLAAVVDVVEPGVAVVGVVTGTDVTGSPAVVGVVSAADAAGSTAVVAVELIDVVALGLTVTKPLNAGVCAPALSPQEAQITATTNPPPRTTRTRITWRQRASCALTLIRVSVLASPSR